MKQRILTFKLLTIVLSLPFTGLACSYTAGTFMSRFRSAEIVIIGKVIDAIGYTENLDTATITFHIERLIKGNWGSDTITIEENLRNSCPGPAKFKQGETLYVLLKKNYHKSSYTTLFYGVGILKIHSETQMNMLDKCLKEYKELQKLQNKRIKHKRMIDWAIECYKNIHTKHIGIEEFYYDGFYYTFDNNKKEFRKAKYSRLTRQQKKKLRNELLKTDYIAYNEYMIILNLANKKDREINVFCLEQLKRYDTKRGIGYREINLMKTISMLNKTRKDLSEILSQIQNMGLNYRFSKELQRLTLEFIEKAENLNVAL
jgi:hypothetical protein